MIFSEGVLRISRGSLAFDCHGGRPIESRKRTLDARGKKKKKKKKEIRERERTEREKGEREGRERESSVITSKGFCVLVLSE